MSQSKIYWSSIARDYDAVVKETSDQSQQLIINPVVQELLGNLTNKCVLDAGCGNGYWTRRMAETAQRVVGVDFTEELIERARSRGVPNNAEFIIGNLERLLLAKNTFDVALMSMVLLDLEDLSTPIAEVARVTKPEGRIIVSTTHPCFENPPYTRSLRDDNGNKTGRVITNYFATGLVKDEVNSYQHWHYKISDVINTFASNGLFVEKMVEPTSNGVMKNGGSDHFPYFLIIRFRKIV